MDERDIQIARRLSTRYQGTSAFGREDAYQACIEGFLKSGSPTDEGLVVHVMRNEMHRQSVEASYLMRVPYSSWKRFDSTPTAVKYTGLSNETLVDTEHWSLAVADQSFNGMEDSVAWKQAFASLHRWEQDVIQWALNEWRRGKRPAGKRVAQFKLARTHLREMLDGVGV